MVLKFFHTPPTHLRSHVIMSKGPLDTDLFDTNFPFQTCSVPLAQPITPPSPSHHHQDVAPVTNVCPYDSGAAKLLHCKRARKRLPVALHRCL